MVASPGPQAAPPLIWMGLGPTDGPSVCWRSEPGTSSGWRGSVRSTPALKTSHTVPRASREPENSSRVPEASNEG